MVFLSDAVSIAGDFTKPRGWEVDKLGRLGRWDPLFAVNGERYGVDQSADGGCGGEPIPPERVTDEMLGEWVDEGGAYLAAKWDDEREAKLATDGRTPEPADRPDTITEAPVGDGPR